MLNHNAIYITLYHCVTVLQHYYVFKTTM